MTSRNRYRRRFDGEETDADYVKRTGLLPSGIVNDLRAELARFVRCQADPKTLDQIAAVANAVLRKHCLDVVVDDVVLQGRDLGVTFCAIEGRPT